VQQRGSRSSTKGNDVLHFQLSLSPNTPPSELVCVAGESVMLLVYMVALLCCLDQRFFLALLVAGPCNTFDQTRTRTNTQPPV